MSSNKPSNHLKSGEYITYPHTKSIRRGSLRNGCYLTLLSVCIRTVSCAVVHSQKNFSPPPFRAYIVHIVDSSCGPRESVPAQMEQAHDTGCKKWEKLICDHQLYSGKISTLILKMECAAAEFTPRCPSLINDLRENGLS